MEVGYFLTVLVTGFVTLCVFTWLSSPGDYRLHEDSFLHHYILNTIKTFFFFEEMNKENQCREFFWSML